MLLSVSASAFASVCLVISKLLKGHSKAERRAPADSRALSGRWVGSNRSHRVVTLKPHKPTIAIGSLLSDNYFLLFLINFNFFPFTCVQPVSVSTSEHLHSAL